ncbi:SLC13 family permease [Schaalia hyovaginalis]|uniref:GntP family permease n=1 Tax=Schaalia hyovaginalis TaxID=29316 RepID=UPI002A761746|nr:SLC13 family permease [Schaalia hyovaginalis]MDY2669044.1 SLC13 family permease [Schaalia hyovaginalis]
MFDLLWLALAIALIVVLILWVKLHPAISLIIGTLALGFAFGMPVLDIATTMTEGFGGLMASLGLSVGFGIILGQLMSDSGGAKVIARTIVGLTTDRFAVYGIAFAAFVLAIPVFFDVTFVILVPLAIAIAREAKKPLPLMIGAVAMGAGTAHTLVPPTPNPLAAGDILGFSVGYMVAVGGLVGLVAVIAGVSAYSIILPKLWRPEMDIAEEPSLQTVPGEDKNPNFFLALLPIVTPLLLILMKTIWGAASGENVPLAVSFLGDKTVALLIGTLVAYLVASRDLTRGEMEAAANKAIESAGIVLLVTGAGGAFGAIIKAGGVSDLIAESVVGLGGGHFVALLACYFVGMSFRVAVGSGTVASITTMTIFASLAPTIGVHPVWVAMACLGGALSIGHINDSGFWVTAKIPGFSITGGLKVYTLPQFIASLVVIILTIIGSYVLPMA